MSHRLIAAWLRTVAGLLALAGVFALTACGGGSGAPNNPFAPTPPTAAPLVVLPGATVVYSRTPATLTVTGGLPPYFAFSSNSAILPVTQAVSGNTVLLVANDVAEATPVTVTILDARGAQVAAAVTVQPAPLLPNLVTVRSNNDCGTAAQDLGGALCSGGTGTATVRLTGPGGGALPNRLVKFDVLQGNFAIQTTNPSTPLVSTLTVTTDVNGVATVGIAIPVNAVTQIGVIRATDLTTGNQVSGQFTITQVTDGSQILSMIPTGETTITGPLKDVCSAGVRVNYFIFGGTPPYQVRAAFPDAVSLVGVPVLTNGGGFTAVTNGSCFENMQFAVTDATGRTIPGDASPTLTNEPGTVEPPAPPEPADLVIAPEDITVANTTPPGPTSTCAGKTFQFTVVGGTPSYGTAVAVNPNPIDPVTGGVTIKPVVTFPRSGLLSVALPATPPIAPGTVITVTVSDASLPQQSATAVITCE